MLPEVEARINKALGAYRDLESYLVVSAEQARSVGSITQKERRRSSIAIGLRSKTSVVETRPHVASAIKLAYLRGARQVDPDYRLSEYDLAMIERGTQRTMTNLGSAVGLSVMNVNAVFRRLGMISVVERTAENTVNGAEQPLIDVLRGKPVQMVVDKQGRSWSLQQYAHATLRNVTESSYARGLAAAHQRQQST